MRREVMRRTVGEMTDERQRIADSISFEFVEVQRSEPAMVDADLAPLMRRYRWHLVNGRYALTTLKDDAGKRRMVLMHRMVLGAVPGSIVDHINGSTLDNRRSNLRIVSAAQNSWNRRPTSEAGFLGVKRAHGGWCASIGADGRETYLGVYRTAEEAAAAYNAAASARYGDLARLNDVPAAFGVIEQQIEERVRRIERMQEEVLWLKALLA